MCFRVDFGVVCTQAVAVQASRCSWYLAPYARSNVRVGNIQDIEAGLVKWSRNVPGKRDVWCEGRLPKLSSGRLLQPPSTSFQGTNIFMHVFVSV